MSESKYIVTEKQLTSAIEAAIKEHISNETIVGELMWSINYNVGTVLEDDCDEFVEEDWDYKGD